MKFNPGETAPKTGTYNVVDSNGKVMNTAEVKRDRRCLPHRAANGTTKSTEFDEKRRFAVFFIIPRLLLHFFRLKL